MDGSFNQQGSNVGIILEGPNGLLIEKALKFTFKASNNDENQKDAFNRRNVQGPKYLKFFLLVYGGPSPKPKPKKAKAKKAKSIP